MTGRADPATRSATGGAALKRLTSKKKQYTLLLLNEEGQVTRMRFSRRTLRLVVFAALLVVLAIGLVIADYIHGKFVIQRLEMAETQPAAADTDIPATEAEEAEAPAEGAQVKVSELLRQAESRRALLEPVDRFFAPQSFEYLSIPDQWPLHGWVTSEFGRRRSPFGRTIEMHQGIDIAAPIDSEVIAPAAGRVVFVGEKPGYGLYLIVRHGHGLSTHYGHLNRILVAPGQQVQAGEPIARSGNTGVSTGPHLHYEVRLLQIPVNPRRYLPKNTPMAAEDA
ncbi:MAG: M23 family metallopeptidase [Alphaproteobacteria bacterium]